jgi:serine/threonine protein kinase
MGRYELIRKLAQGGMAEVFLARAEGPGGFAKTLVLKRILPHLAEDESFAAMFLSEARLASRLSHTNIVQIFDCGRAGNSYYLGMEYIDGPNLRTLGRCADKLGDKVPLELCAWIIAEACEGLAYAHEFCDPATRKPLDLVHRDVSLDNILVSREGMVKVVDFGIAKAADQVHRTATGIVKGKLSYMPPEQLRGLELDRRVDVYALGVVLYELLTCRKPFDANTEASLAKAILFEPCVPAVKRRPDLPKALQKILDRALAKDRAKRYPDCRAFQADLEAFLRSRGKPMGSSHLAEFVTRMSAAMPAAPQPVPPPFPKRANEVETRASGERRPSINTSASMRSPEESSAELSAPMSSEPTEQMTVSELMAAVSRR